MNENLKEIILPIELKPAIVSRNIHAIHLSVIEKVCKQGINYVYNNFIQLQFMYEADGRVTFDYVYPRYKNLSIFRTCSVDKPTFTINSINIKNYIIRGLLCGKYIFTSVDEYYIPNRLAYKHHHFGHDILLYGYNAKENIFNIIGYTDSGHYLPSTINCEEFVIAYLHSYGNKSIDLVEPVSYYNHKIEKELIIVSLEDYANSDNKSRLLDKSKWLSDNETYGIATYEKVNEYLEKLANGKVNYDKRVIYTLMEHKYLMSERFKYLVDKKIINDDETVKNKLVDNYKKACIAFGFYLKYFVTKETSYLKKISSVLDKIKDDEIDIIPQFVELLRKGVN